MDENCKQDTDGKPKNCIEESIRIYGAWDASESSLYGFIYRLALFEITRINFHRRKHSAAVTAAITNSNSGMFGECNPFSNSSNDTEYFLCLEMKNMKCDTLRSSPFVIKFGKNEAYEHTANIVICVKYPHFNHLKANYMTLSIQKRSKGKPKLLAFHQTVARVFINMEYVLQNNKINSVTLDCNKSKVFDNCEIFFKNISTNAIPVTINTKKYRKNRWSIRKIPYTQVAISKFFSPRLKRNFSYLKNQDVYNIISESDEDINALCYEDDSSTSANDISGGSVSVASSNQLLSKLTSHRDNKYPRKNTSFVYSLVNTPELTPNALEKLISNQSHETDVVESVQQTNTSFLDNLPKPTCNSHCGGDECNIQNYDINQSEIDKEKITISSHTSTDSISNMISNISTQDYPHSSINDYITRHQPFNILSNSNDSDESSSYIVPANILVFISDSASIIPKKLYKLYKKCDHLDINCVYLKSCNWIREFIEEWNIVTNSGDLFVDNNSQKKCRIFLFGNDQIINKFINELAASKRPSSTSNNDDRYEKEEGSLSKFLEFLFIPTEFPSFYADYISTLSPLYKDCFLGQFWKDCITNGIQPKDDQQIYNHFLNFIYSDNYKIVLCDIGRAVLHVNDMEQNINAFISSLQIINCKIGDNNQNTTENFDIPSDACATSYHSSNKYMLEYTIKNDDTQTVSREKIKIKQASKIFFKPMSTYINISILYGHHKSDRYSLTRMISRSSSSNIKTICACDITIYRYNKNKKLPFNVYIDGNLHSQINCLNVYHSWNSCLKNMPLCIPVDSKDI